MARFRPLVWSLIAATSTVGALLVPGGNAAAAQVPFVSDPASMVNPLIGTTNGVDQFPGPDVPFGMIQWGPDTPSRPSGGGYEYTDKTVTGYSLTHLSGPGCPAEGDVPILPTTGAIGTDPSNATQPLDHTAETASAGYYQLASGGITTQLTSTARSGMGSFTFPASTSSNLLFKLSDSATGTTATHWQVISNTEVSGWVSSGQFCNSPTESYTVYFDMVFNQPFTAQGTWTNKTVNAGAKALTDQTPKAPTTGSTSTHSRTSKQTPTVHGATPKAKAAVTPQISPPVAGSDGAYVTFDTSKNQTVLSKVGISYVSTGNATANRAAENSGWNFTKVQKAAHDSWNTLLNKIQVGGGSATDQTVFYTALYHSLMHPNVFSDVNGEYMGFDDQLHNVAAGHVQYANYSGWDVYRSQVQLAALLAPQQTSDSIRSMLADYEQSGQLPKWALNNGETYVMVGDPADPIIADAYAFGARDFDQKEALQAMLAEADTAGNIRPGLNYYEADGYLPMDGTYGCCNFYGPVSTQQEYNSADHALATYAAAQGDTTDAAALNARANNWANVFNPGSGYLEPKYLNGQFVPGFVPGSGNGFVEASAAQYTPMVPFDVQGMVNAAGGDAAWIKRLDSLNTNFTSPTSMNADLSNEPSLEIPWEYDYVGAPYRAQEVIRQVQTQLWTDQPAGFIGNDDLGEMASWYVWSAIGMYPETPGSSTMVLGSPLFPRTAVHLAGNKTLTVNAPTAATDAPYVQSLTANGTSWSHAFLPSGMISNGGQLNYVLGTTPNTSWGSKASDAPPSDTTGLLPALGYVGNGGQVIVAPGSTSTVTFGVRNLTNAAQSVSWTASPQTGLAVGPTNGTLSVPAGGDGTQAVSVTAPSTEGRYLVTFTPTTATGTKLPNVLLEVDVAAPGSLWPYYNNVGDSTDGQASNANYDGDGYLYSANALAAAGVTPGATVTSDGVSYLWPNVPAGQLNDIEAAGQTIPVALPAGATKIGLLGSATNSDVNGATGTLTVNYTDGTTQQIPAGFSDWTLGAGAFGPLPGNTTVATTPYRNVSDGTKQVINTYLFATDGTLTAGKTVASVTLPTPMGGDFHVFAIGNG